MTYQNHVLVGNLGQDPEGRYTPQGKFVVDFSLALNRQYTDNQGNKVKQTEWVKIVCWERLAETVNQYCKKGSQVLVESNQAKAEAWINKNSGEARAKTVYTASTVRFLGSRNDNGNGNGQQQPDPVYDGADPVAPSPDGPPF